MSYELTWEDITEDPSLEGFFERGAAPKDGEPTMPVPHLRIVVEGEVFIALLDPRWNPSGVHDEDGEYEFFHATDAYDAIEKAYKVIAERKKKQTRTRGKK
jgi:hypothetical protein